MRSLTELRQNASTEVKIMHPTEGHVATATVLSRDSAPMQKAALEASTKRMAKLQRGNRMKVSAEEIQEEAIDMLVTATVAIKGENGFEFDSNPEAIRALYANPDYIWLRKQVDEAMGDSELFFGK